MGTTALPPYSEVLLTDAPIEQMPVHGDQHLLPFLRSFHVDTVQEITKYQTEEDSVASALRVIVRVSGTDSKKNTRLYWALMFLVVALIAGVLGFTGIAVAAAGVAKVLFLVFLVLFVIHWLLISRGEAVESRGLVVLSFLPNANGPCNIKPAESSQPLQSRAATKV